MLWDGQMKLFFFVLTFLMPLPAFASVWLADCDHRAYAVIIRNAGSMHTATVSPTSGKIEEFGPPEQISFQIKGEKQPIVRATSPDEEFCIWSGKIRLQRLNTGRANSGGSSL